MRGVVISPSVAPTNNENLWSDSFVGSSFETRTNKLNTKHLNIKINNMKKIVIINLILLLFH